MDLICGFCLNISQNGKPNSHSFVVLGFYKTLELNNLQII